MSSASPPAPLVTQQRWLRGWSEGKENPNTPLSAPGPNFSVFVYLPWKRPHGLGRKWANSRRLAGLGNKEPHCAPRRALPNLGMLRSPKRGICVGARAGRRRGAEGQPALPASPPMKGLLCGAVAVDEAGTQRGMAPRGHREPTWHWPASPGGRRETPESPGPGTPSFSWADATPQPWNILPSASPPGFQLPTGSSPDLKPPCPGRERGCRGLWSEPCPG